MSAPTFADITIDKVDEEETLRHKDPPPSGLYLVHLKLSARPPQDWATLFDEERKSLRMLSRSASVSGQYLTVHCLPEEVERDKPELVEDVKNTNLRYRERLETLRDGEEREQKAKEAERVAALRELGKIKF